MIANNTQSVLNPHAEVTFFHKPASANEFSQPANSDGSICDAKPDQAIASDF